MGYYTQINIDIRPVKVGADVEPASNALSKFLDEEFGCGVGECGIGEFQLEDARWYNNEDDIAKISENYPDVVFIIWGDGDDSDDIWELYCYRGHIQRGMDIVYIPFDADLCVKDVGGLLTALCALKGALKDDDPLIKELEERCKKGSLSIYDGT